MNCFSTTYAYEEFLKLSGPNQDNWLSEKSIGLLRAAMNQEIGAFKGLRNYAQHADLPLGQWIARGRDEQGMFPVS